MYGAVGRAGVSGGGIGGGTRRQRRHDRGRRDGRHPDEMSRHSVLLRWGARQSTPLWSATAELLGLRRQRGEHLLVGGVEAGDALVLQGQSDVVHVDAGRGEPAHHLGGLVHSGVDGAGQGAVVGERGDGDLGQGVDRVRADQFVDVAGVGIGRVLGGGRGPQRPLRARPERGQALPPLAGEPLPEQPVGELGLGDRRPAAQRRRRDGAGRLEAPVDLGVDPADEERGDAVYARRVAAALDEGFEPGQVCLDDLLRSGRARRSA